MSESAEQVQNSSSGNSDSKIKILIIIVVLAAAGIAGYQWFSGRGATGALRISGNVEVDDAEVSFRVAGRIAERAVEEGQSVEIGRAHV